MEEITHLNRTSLHQRREAAVQSVSAIPTSIPRRDLFVYFSDVDELLDADALSNYSHRLPGCMGVRQKVFMYNERCFMKGTR
jgi:hypothetical protein